MAQPETIVNQVRLSKIVASKTLVSPIANAFAIPLISFMVTPLALAGSVLCGCSHRTAGRCAGLALPGGSRYW
jgi:hypothetical protein